MSLDALRHRLAVSRARLKSHQIIVLAGGMSAEREVSLESGRSAHESLQSDGYQASLAVITDLSSLVQQTSCLGLGSPGLYALGETEGAGTQVASRTQASHLAPVVVSMLHGAEGENGSWQGLFELLNVPYTGARVKGSALAMDKVSSKRIFEQLGVPTPRWSVLDRESVASMKAIAERFGGTDTQAAAVELVAKPTEEGSSIGLLMFENSPDGWEAAKQHHGLYGALLIEERIRGRELTIALLGPANEACELPLVEISPHEGVYDFEHKYSSGASTYICPAQIDDDVRRDITEYAKRVYAALALDPCARLDIMLDQNSTPFFLEANTLPGFTANSLLPKAAQAAGIEYLELLELLVLFAVERQESKLNQRGGARHD